VSENRGERPVRDDAGNGSAGMIRLGDMLVLGHYPPQLLQALAVIADTIHPAFAAQGCNSTGKCILVSHAARDFLCDLGFDARVRSVSCIMRSFRGDTELHSLVIGGPPAAYGAAQPTVVPGYWDGHVVVTCPKQHLLLDCTLRPVIRPHWNGALAPMMALPLEKPVRQRPVFGMPRIACAEFTDDPDFTFGIMWLDRPGNKSWRDSGDTEPWRRDLVVRALRNKISRCVMEIGTSHRAGGGDHGHAGAVLDKAGERVT
jgi:hypothetical protein